MTKDKSKDMWRSIAEAELRGKSVDDLTWKTLEGIDVQPVYNAADLEGVSHLGSMPGEGPFTRGGRSVNMPVSRRPKNPTPFIAATSLPVSRGSRWPLIWPRIAGTPATIRVLRAMWARLAWQLTASRI